MIPESSTQLIGIYSMTVKIFTMDHRIGSNIKLPEFIMKNQNINSMIDSTNNMCFWNCYAFHKSKERKCFKLGKELFEKYYEVKPNKSFKGFDYYNEILPFEEKENIGLNVFELNGNNELVCIKHSENEDNYMNLLLYLNHFSYIKNLDLIDGTKYKCTTCGTCFIHRQNLITHIPNCQDFVKKDVFEKHAKIYEPRRNLIVELNQNLNCDCDILFEPLIVFDFESLLLTMKNKQISRNLKLKNQHQAVSVSIYSNIKGFNNKFV
jgi:hypothetical protein